MFKLLAVIILVVGALWFFTSGMGESDGNYVEEKQENLQLARDSVSAMESAAAAAAAQSEDVNAQITREMGQ